MDKYKYCHNLSFYKRRKTIEVKIGNIPLGGNNPIRVQSMTTCNTMDTTCTVQQTIRMVKAGCEYVRITAPGIKEAKNLKYIKQELLAQGIKVPLAADIHYTPNAAIEAAKYVEKVRINPGNYADKKRFKTFEYTDASYKEEIKHIKEKFIPLINQCKKHKTALRIGTNHGSLSDRILSRYGDTPMGMVESALEFVRICEAEKFFDIVLSMKSSNTRIMVQAYRLLVNKLEKECLKAYPLHLGVTEAGDGEDGRIKSSVGIGTLLEDGLGDTIRVSLTEEPEFEIPVAEEIIKRYKNLSHHGLKKTTLFSKNPFEYATRKTNRVLDFGGDYSPRVIADYSTQNFEKVENLSSIDYKYIKATHKWISLDTAADYVYLGKNNLKMELPKGLKAILDAIVWNKNRFISNTFPVFTIKEYLEATHKHKELNFIEIDISSQNKLPILNHNIVLILTSNARHPMPLFRQFILRLMEQKNLVPVVLRSLYFDIKKENFQLYASTDVGGVLIDGLGNGIMINLQSSTRNYNYNKLANNTAFGILQATRTRMSKTEYISCPSCGRTLFNLQLTTAKIKEKTDHLKGIKIGIMGCIVNGPGEMADADYGYVGAGVEKISLYKGQKIVKKGLKPEVAVDALIQLIKEDGKWVEQSC